MADLNELKRTVDELDDVSRMVAVSRDGTSLLTGQKKRHEALGSYVAYVVMTAEQLKPHLSFNGPCHLIMKQSSGAKILIVPGKEAILGLDLEPEASSVQILEQIAPIFDNIVI